MGGLGKVCDGWNGVGLFLGSLRTQNQSWEIDGFAQKAGEVSLWNDEIGEGLMTKKIKYKLDVIDFFIN